MIPKGGNAIHGSGFSAVGHSWGLQSDNLTPDLIARGEDRLPHPARQRLQRSVGGPIVKDKLW